MAQQPPPIVEEPLPGTYRELYSTATFQAGEPEPARLIASYRFTEGAGGGERPTPSALKEQTFAFSDRRPMAFLCLARTTGTAVEVRVLHRMMRYFELPGGGAGGAPTDLSMGLLGDVRTAQIPVVEVDNGPFSLVGVGGGVRVPTVAVMPDQLMAAPPGTYLGPYVAEDPDTEVVRPRFTQVIPTKYAAALVNRDGVSPAMAYRELYGMFEADRVLEACNDVLIWLRAACTARGGAGELAPLPAVAYTFALMLLPEAVSEYVATKVLSDLPGRKMLGGGGRGGTQDPMATVLQQLAESVGGVSTRGEREPRGVMESYRETYPLLLRHCHVTTVEELAPIWGRLARGSKGEQQSILQQELARVCTERGLMTDVYCPAVTSGLKQMVTSLNFAGHGPDDLTGGCQPFLVAYTGADDHYRALDRAMEANQLDQGAANASLADIREIRESEKIKLPHDLNQVSYTFQRFAVLAHVLFQGPGVVNPFVKAMWTLASTFGNRLPVYLNQHQLLRGTPWHDVYPAHIVRHVQVTVYEYLQMLQVSHGEVPDPPDFRGLHLNLGRGSFQSSPDWLPLPAAVTVAPAPTTPTPVGTASIVTRSTRASAAASTVSGLTATTTGGRTDPRSAGVYVANPARDVEFDTLQLRPQMRDLLRLHPPPRNNSGHEFCVSWWGRGGCYTNCSRAATHCPFANADERARLLAHVRTHLTTTTVSPSAAAGT